METSDFTAHAIELIEQTMVMHSQRSFGHEFLIRVRQRLIDRFEVDVTGRRKRITTEQAALAMLRGASLELESAGKALDSAAEQLRDAGVGKVASVVKQAASRAKAAAGELVPS
jgi:hypothetical protein